MHRRAVVSNQKFIYKREGDHLVGKLKYFQHRDDRDTHIRQHNEQGEVIPRWVDRGLGDHYKEIAANCYDLATTGLKNPVGARTLVISPQVDMMQAIPENQRPEIIAELTENTVERWFEEMGKPVPEYSYVVHRGDAKTECPEGLEREDNEFYHSHVVLAPTVPGLNQNREDYKVYTEQLDLLHELSNAEMERIWTRELGQERVQVLNDDLEKLTQELERIDAEREAQQHLEDQELAQQFQTIPDPTLLDFYALLEFEPPDELVQFQAQTQQDWQQEPETLSSYSYGEQLIEVFTQLGVDLPDTDLRQVEQEQQDFLAPFRELGFEFPEDDAFELEDDYTSVIEMFQELGFEIEPENLSELEPESPQIDDDLFDLEL